MYQCFKVLFIETFQNRHINIHKIVDKPTKPEIMFGTEKAQIPLNNSNHFPNKVLKIILPTLRSIPCLVIGIPVSLETSCFTLVIPKALFHEKDTPGILNPIIIISYNFWLRNCSFVKGLSKCCHFSSSGKCVFISSSGFTSNHLSSSFLINLPSFTYPDPQVGSINIPS